MKIFAVVYVLSHLVGMIGPFNEHNKTFENIKACHEYIINNKQKIEKYWSNQEKIEALRKEFPNVTKGSVFVKCEEAEDSNPEYKNL